MRNSQRIGIFILVILGVLFCLAGILAQYSEINQSYPQAKSVEKHSLCNSVKTNFVPSPIRLSFLIYFETHKCYVSSDSISQVELWYKKMGWKTNLEDGGLIKDTRTNLFLINKTTFHRVFLSANNNSTEINAGIMILVNIFPK